MIRLILTGLFALGLSRAEAGWRDDPQALIRAVYETYRGDEIRPEPPNLYSRRLQALIDADERQTPKGELGRFDWNVFTDASDYKLTGLRIDLIEKTVARAVVRARFKNMGRPTHIVFDLVREPKGWAIDEVRSMQPPAWTRPAWTMSRRLKAIPDAVRPASRP